MQSYFKIEDSGRLQASLTASMSLNDWKALRDQMNAERWPSCDLVRAIQELVDKAEQIFYSNGSSDDA